MFEFGDGGCDLDGCKVRIWLVCMWLMCKMNSVDLSLAGSLMAHCTLSVSCLSHCLSQSHDSRLSHCLSQSHDSCISHCLSQSHCPEVTLCG